MLERVDLAGLDVLTSPGLRQAGVRVAFTGRGAPGPDDGLESLNLSFNVGDERSRVLANRVRVARSLGMPLEAWVTCGQVHGTAVAEVTSVEVGRGAMDHASALPRTDGLVTRLPGAVLGVLTADCVPVVLVDPAGPSIEVVHAGWRGVLYGILARGLGRLAPDRPADVVALIGPHIRSCCMEVGEELAGRFAREYSDSVVTLDGLWRLDLARACAAQLAGGGVSEENIHASAECTCCSPGYFSFRRQERCGRQAALVVIGGS